MYKLASSPPYPSFSMFFCVKHWKTGRGWGRGYVHARFADLLGIGGFSVTNFTVLDTGVVGADTALLVAMDTLVAFCCSLTGGWSELGAFDSIKMNIGLSSTILKKKKISAVHTFVSLTLSQFHIQFSCLLLYVQFPWWAINGEARQQNSLVISRQYNLIMAVACYNTTRYLPVWVS